MWIEKVFELGGLNYMDVVSVHPYRWHRWNDLSPETLEPDMVKLTELIAKYNTTGKPRPIWDTEVSWPSGGEWVSEETQADYLVRTYIVSIASGVEKIYWYEMGGHSYPPDAPYRGWESGYAVLHHLKNPIGSLTPKPSFVSLAVMTRQLTGAEFVSRDKSEEWIRSYAFEKDGQPIRVMWSMQSGTVAVRVEAPITVVDIMGEPVTLTPVDGVVYLTLSGSPLYLKGRISGISPTRAVEVTGRAEAAMGDKLPVTLAVDMPGPFSGVFEVEGTTWEFSAEKGGKVTKTIVVDGSDVGGERKVTYRLASGGKVIGMGSLNTTMQPRLTLSAGLEDPEHLAVWIRNSSATAECRLTALNWRIGGREGGQKLSETLKPSGTRKLSIPFGAPQPYRIFPVSVVVTCPDRSKLEFKDNLSYSPCARRNVKIDGVLDEWQGPAIVLSKVGKVRAQGQGRPDVDGRAMIGWDNQFFYLAAEITDDVHHQAYPEEEEWRGDGLQFGLAWESSGYEFGAALTKQGVKVSTFVAPMGFLANEFAKRAKTAVKRNGKTLIYELAIPWDSIPPISPKNGEFLFSFLVNDNDGRGREGWVEWASGIGGNKELGFYQACRFVGR